MYYTLVFYDRFPSTPWKYKKVFFISRKEYIEEHYVGDVETAIYMNNDTF